MDSNCMTSSTSLHIRSHFNFKRNQSWAIVQQNSQSNCINIRIYHAYSYNQQLQLQRTSSFTLNGYAKKAKTSVIRLSLDVKPFKDPNNKRGTIAGIDSNVSMRRKKGKEDRENELEVISIRTMAQETLGDWGGTLASLVYIFLGYTSVIAYSSKSGEILFHLINLPAPVSGFLFTTVFTLLISIGGTRATDQVNQLLTASMIGLLVAIEVLAVMFGGWSGLEGSGNWGKIPPTIPVIIFSLVYHDLAPVLCAYLGSDLKRLRISVVLGSLVPLLGLLVWDAIALGLSAQTDQMVDPLELLMRVKWGGVSYMVEAFSLLAVGTSLIGTLLGFSEFFKEQLNSFSSNYPLTQTLQKLNIPFDLRKWWACRNVSFTSVALVVIPSLLVSTTIPDAFSTATDVAGGYCMTMLYGVLPPAMAWSMDNKERDNASDQKTLSRARPVLFAVGLLACGIVGEQIFQDILTFQF